MTSASISTVRRTWRRVAPIARSAASSRLRWATTMAKVLAMISAPTNSEIAEKALSAPVMMAVP
jgi:hypothetical protein